MKMSAGYKRAGMGSDVSSKVLSSDSWPGANVKGSDLNSGSDKNWQGKGKSKTKKGYRKAVG